LIRISLDNEQGGASRLVRFGSLNTEQQDFAVGRSKNKSPDHGGAGANAPA
jgi:hypothetical protein